jgi:hypothetical protein
MGEYFKELYMPEPKKNTALIFYASLTDASNRPAFKASPTLATGDFQVSTNGGSFGNLTTLPTVTPAGGVAVKFSLSADEMNGDQVVVQCIDAAGAEWDDLLISINTSINVLDDLATPAQVNTEVVDALNVDLMAELVQGIPTATPTMRQALMALYMALRNRLDIDTSGAIDYKEFYDDSGSVIYKKALTDDGSTYSEAEMEAGP